jgi:hypothetical protein
MWRDKLRRSLLMHVVGYSACRISPSSLSPTGADGVDAELSRHFERGGPHKTFEAGVDHRDGSTSRRWVHRKYTRCQGDRTALTNVILPYPGIYILAHR